MDLLLKDKVAWITGASGGIGRAVAEVLADEGMFVALHGNAAADTMRAWTEDQPWRDRALCVSADVRDAEAMDRAADAIAERFGRIDVCVANAGRWPAADECLDQMPLERLRETLDVNLFGALLTARAFQRRLRESGPREDGHGASLTFVGSTAGRFGERFHADYAVSKAGLIGAMQSLKNELPLVDPHARVNVVEPGWTVTHMAKPALEVPGAVERVTSTMALRQLARAEDIARTIAVLSSPFASSHLTGQVVTAAGGMEGRLLWSEDQLDREAILARLSRD